MDITTNLDPRAENCKRFAVNNMGKVIGVELIYIPMPNTKYQLYNVYLVDEISAVGRTVAKFNVINKNGIPVYENVAMSYPWTGNINDLKYSLLPGNPNQEHIISNGYKPPEHGPLAIHVGKTYAEINSDIIAGLGLPNNAHVSYQIVFIERDTSGEENPPPSSEIKEELKDIARAIYSINTTLLSILTTKIQ
jgi:hypothetical protein